MDVSHILAILLLLFVACADCEENVNMTTRTITGTKNWDGALKAFRETVVRVFLHSPALKATMMGHPIGIATVWLLYVIETVQPKGLSTWEQLGDKVDQRISEKVNDNNIESLRTVFNRITYIMGKAKRVPSTFKKDDLSLIRSKAPAFFPQTFSAGGYTGDWCSVLMKYLTILNAGYIDLMKQKKYGECAWANALNVLRAKVLGAVKKLAKSRYQAIEKVRWSGGTTKFKPWARLALKDGATGKTYERMPITTVKSRFLNALKGDTKSYLMENLVDKFNLLYNDAWIGENCNVPAKITENEVASRVGMPKSCMDRDNKCELPCGLYSEDYKWCVTGFRGGNYWETNSGGGGRAYRSTDKNWAYCNDPNWGTCMPTKDTSLINWQDEDYDKKMKMRQMKKEKAQEKA